MVDYFQLAIGMNSIIMNCLTGKIVTDSQFFKDENNIWPEGYTAMRKFTSLKGNLLISFWLFLTNQIFSVFG